MKNLLFFLLGLFSCCAGAQNLMPPIHNYRVFEYNAASKNWGLAVGDDGELFVANNKGLLHYNGEEWKLDKLPNKTTIRSVAYIDGKIYTGSYEEFGYWEKDNSGLLQYTSLTHLIKGHEFTSEEFWQILPFKGAILFRSFPEIYIYEKGKITVLNTNITVTDMAVYNEKVVVGSGVGLFWLENGKLVPIADDGVLKGKTIIDMGLIKEGLLIGTKLQGCYLLKNNRITPWAKDINKDLEQYQLNKMLPLSNGKVAFGTIKDGVYIYNNERDTYVKLNREKGLQNNTVLSLLQFRNQLWIGLDNGIDRVQLNNPITYYTDYSGVLGTVYDLKIHKGTMYLGSNTGVYYFKGDGLQFVNGSQGHVWDLEVMDGDLFCGHNTGTFEIDKGKLTKVSTIAGGYQIVKVPEQQSVFIQGTYIGLAKYVKELKGGWKVHRISGFDFPVKQLCFENPTTIWVAHPYKGFYRLKLDSKYEKVLHIQEFGTDVLPNNYNVKLFNIKNQIVFYSEGKWYKYDSILSKIKPFEEFKEYANWDLLSYDDAHFWFIDNENTKEIVYTNLKEDNIVISDAQLKKRIVPEAENIIKLNDSTYYFTLVDGFAKINLSQLQLHLEDSLRLPVPKLSYFKDSKKLHSINKEPLRISFRDSRNITIKVASPSVVQPRYYYELEGRDSLSSYLEEGDINFQNLAYGSYTLKVYTVGIDNKKSKAKMIRFELAPPWYLSIWSIGAYFLVVLGVVLLVRRYNKWKLDKRHDKLKEKLHREQEERLAHLEKEKLAKEIKLKQKELANTTLNIAKKNEMILELKNLLTQNKDKFPNQQRYRSFMKRLDNSVNDNEDWKRFELSFKELHEDFFEKLLERYSKLTPKDLKLCAYLKMNLSSKEIAPLMAITIRGVEIHRYRLRKKLKLDSSENISNFLITLK